MKLFSLKLDDNCIGKFSDLTKKKSNDLISNSRRQVNRSTCITGAFSNLCPMNGITVTGSRARFADEEAR